MFAWVELPAISFGAWTIHPYPLFVAAAVLAGRWAFVKAATVRGLHADLAKAAYAVVLLAAALAGAAWMAVREPALLRSDPRMWLGLLASTSSWAGIAGGVSAALFFTWYAKLDGRRAWRLCDSFAWAFPFGWLVLRLGCAWTHHHPGIASSSPLAVQYPGGSRYDLALLEALVCLGLIVWLLAMRRRSVAEGLVSGAMLVAVGGFRYAFDGLRLDRTAAADVWGSAGALALSALGVGAIFYSLLRRQGGTGGRKSELESMVA